ncbi:hypothetical protein D3C80_665140 [compost metagenome]
MAIRPDYDIGTVTLVASSANFTTTGASLQTAAVQAGDAIITPSGHVLIIASVTGQNSGTLFLPCPVGAAGTDLPLRIRFQPDGSRYQGAVRNLVDLLSSGNVEAFAALVGANGMVPIFTGPGTMDLADPATFGIQDPNGSLGKLAALTLAARQILQTDAAGSLKAINLSANQVLATDENKDVVQIPRGTLGDALIRSDVGTTGQIIQANGAIINKSDLPVSAATQTALNGKFDKTGGALSGGLYSSGEISTTISGGNYSPAITTSIGTAVRTALLTELSPGNYSQAILQTVQDGTTAYNFAFRYGVGFISPGVVNGTVKNFEIDHTADPDNYDLRHAATESPELLVEYRGTAQLVNGRATVNVENHYGVMPDTFANLWIDGWVTSLQNQDGFDRIKPSRVNGATFEIICENQNSNDLVTWELKARRNDPYVRWEGCPVTDANGKLIIEFEKDDV